MKKSFMALLMLCLAMFSAANAESTAAAYEKTIRIHDALPPCIIRITVTGEDNADLASDNILLVEVFSENGKLLQSFTYFSNESPIYDDVIALVIAQDLNLDGYNDLMQGENVTVLVDACGPENGWVRVLYSLGEHHSLSLDEYDTGRTTLTGYIWHSFLEPAQ